MGTRDVELVVSQWFAAEAHVHARGWMSLAASSQRVEAHKRLVEALTSLSLRSFKAHSSLVPIYFTTASQLPHMIISFIQYTSHEPPPHMSLTTLSTNLLILIGVLIPSLVPESIVQKTKGKEEGTHGQFRLTPVRLSTAMAGAPRSWAPTFLLGDQPEG